MATRNSREERRKRILRTGSDRLALITGRIKTLPSSSQDSDRLHRSYSNLAPQAGDASSSEDNDRFHRSYSNVSTKCSSSSPLKDHDRFYRSSSILSPPSDPKMSDQTNGNIPANPGVEGESFCSSTSEDYTNVNASSTGSQIEPQLHKFETYEAEATQAPNPIDEMLSDSDSDYDNYFTPKRVISSIADTESLRNFSSLMIALLVFLSHTDHPLLGWMILRSEIVIASRPLCIVLLTDIAIVVARLLLERRIEFYSDDEEEGSVSQEKGQGWAGAIKFLERGLIVHQTLYALFTDFCIYAVVVICGFSFV